MSSLGQYGLYDISVIHDDIRKNLKHYLNLPNPPPYNLHLNHFAGAGKTTITAEELLNSYSIFIYLTSKHELAAEQMKNNPAFRDLLQIESRQRLCQNETYVMFAQNGINIKHFCPMCPLISICEYYVRIREIWKEPQSWIGVHAHLGGLPNQYAIQNPVDVVVIDENFVPSIFKQYRFDYQSIILSSDLLYQMPDSNEKALLIEYLRDFVFTLQHNPMNYANLVFILHDYYQKSGSSEKLKMFAEEYEKFLAQFYYTKRKIFKNVITFLIYGLINIEQQFKPLSDPTALDYIQNVIQFDSEHTSYIEIDWYDTDALNFACKVLILDATTPTNFYQKLFARKIEALQKNMNINSVIYQTTSAKYVMRTLDQESTRNRLLEIVRLIVKKHKTKILVISRKKYEKEVKEVNPRLVITDHYPLAGSNQYNDIDVCVVFGTPEPRRDLLHRQAMLLNCSEDEILYILRESNILQAIHRIRPTLKLDKPTYIYLLTSVDLPFRNIKKLSIGRLERLLQGEITDYITEENEDRIRGDILDILQEATELSASDIVKKIKGNRTIVSEILHRLEKDDLIESVAKDKNGRKNVVFKLK